MAFLKLCAVRMIPKVYSVTTAVIAYLENVNVIQGRIPKNLYLEIIANAITSHVTITIITIMSFALANIMVFANARTVFGFQDGEAFQDTFHVTVGAQMTPALPSGYSSSILYALDMEYANVANANVKK